MSRVKTIIIFSFVAVGQMVWTTNAEAGPLLDWLRNRRRCCQPVRAFLPPANNCGTCQTTCTQTCSRTVVNYVPYTAYRTDWERVPVTTYRQSSSTDPCTGCTVTCNRPCTTYSWRMKQTPFTTYRPVYRQETYQVPVTYSSPAPQPACNTCAMPSYAPSGDCSSCSVPQTMQAPAGTLQPANGYYEQPGNVTYEPMPAGGSQPADLQPTLVNPTNTQRPSLDSSSNWPTQIPTRAAGTNIRPMQDPNPSSRWNNSAPQLLNPFNKSASAPAVEKWDYSPVRLASYTAVDRVPAALQRPEMNREASREFVGSVQSSQPVQRKPRINEGWRTD